MCEGEDTKDEVGRGHPFLFQCSARVPDQHSGRVEEKSSLQIAGASRILCGEDFY